MAASLISREIEVLQAQLKTVKHRINLLAPDGNYCKRCFSTQVYWMTVVKPTLFDNDGGVHRCKPNPDDFEVIPNSIAVRRAQIRR